MADERSKNIAVALMCEREGVVQLRCSQSPAAAARDLTTQPSSACSSRASCGIDVFSAKQELLSAGCHVLVSMEHTREVISRTCFFLIFRFFSVTSPRNFLQIPFFLVLKRASRLSSALQYFTKNCTPAASAVRVALSQRRLEEVLLVFCRPA